ncbi:endolytic transglycosylase MltG [Cognatilysobacter lacus]|uniref:Endolytic murein transglycosylase n=1 Tax=Cognatilysobacter lacus TaxID=1643323 RepID=A0A5D8Z4F6_9GAMM|nr:endolytic transglycosylase MltG [Lysobacter lacus]TZF89641.1 endolytic transglycosylase MltG [Lysobacter lacus]
MSRPRKRRTGCFTLLLLIAIAAALAFAWYRYDSFADTPLRAARPGASVVVRPGDSLTKVLRNLHDAGVEGSVLEWGALARQLGAAGRLQVGEYRFEPGMTPRQLLIDMRDGHVVQHKVTIVEGWNIRDVRAALAKAEPLVHNATTLDDAALMAKLGHPGQHPEGRFLPETYVFTRGDTELDVLGRAYKAMDKALDAAWRSRRPDAVLKTPDEMLTLASIVEKETGIAEERPAIAGLFEQRLKLGMLLQTDPTVIYGMGTSYAGNIRKSDLLTDTPYNTYTRAGLPPTPIAMPGIASLQAVANPAPGDALYFVAQGDGSGRHFFAKTLAEHQQNVQKYLANYRAAQAAPR